MDLKAHPQACELTGLPVSRGAAAQRLRLRELLAGFIAEAASGQLPVRSPPAHAVWASRGAGHFHLGAELFLQVQGSTQFSFPQGQLNLQPREALVMPPKLLHDERVSAGAEAPFCNLVIYADQQSLSCHTAFEEQAARPGIAHLEVCRHVEAARIQGWLADAARPPGQDTHGLWPAQQRALVLTVLTAVWRLLDAPQEAAPPEPALLAKLRVLIQNQLGDVDLTVAQLAAQLDCTADYLSHLYSRTTGEHLRPVILRQRLDRAARLLTESHSAIKEVAWCCGFGSASYFIRSFRQQFGMTPKAYRATATQTGSGIIAATYDLRL